jgi:hypothetical protein
LIEWCCFICVWLGVDFEMPMSPESKRNSRRRSSRSREHHQHPHHELNNDNHSFTAGPHSRSHSPHLQGLHHSVGDLVHIPGSGNLTMKRSTSLKSDRLLVSTSCGNGGPSSPPIPLTDDMLPPPPLPPAISAFRKQVRAQNYFPSETLTNIAYTRNKLLNNLNLAHFNNK